MEHPRGKSVMDGFSDSEVLDLRNARRGGSIGEMDTEELLASAFYPSVPIERAATAAHGIFRQKRRLGEIVKMNRLELRCVEGVCDEIAETVSLLAEVHLRILLESIQNNEISDAVVLLRMYYQNVLSQDVRYKVVPIYTRNGKFLKAGEFILGSGEEIFVYPREIVKNAMLVDADGVMLVFGRGFGDEDLTATERSVSEKMRRSCEVLSINYHGEQVVCLD